MKNFSPARIFSAVLLLVITVVDVAIAINDFIKGNVGTGVMLLVMAAIICGTAIRTLFISHKN